MNAPATPAAIAEPMLRLFPIGNLHPSTTHVQELRRQRYDDKALKELTENIKAVGVLQNLVVRSIGKEGHLEIVAGERRWRAAKSAGLSEILVSIRQLTDAQVLELQLVENLQREGLHELEEAEGYEELMKLKKINAEAVGDMVGKSRSYVYARTKLLALCPEARTAFYAGELDSSKALLVARIGHHDTQRAALKDLAGSKWDGPLSYREAHRHIVETYMLKLKAAPFALDDGTLVAKAGTCTACPKRTGNQKELFADVKDADTCTDPKCFGEKRTAHFERKRIAAEKAGKKVITGAEAKAVFPHDYREEPAGGYVGLDTTCWDDSKNRKVRELLTKHPEAIDLIQNPRTQELVEAVRSSTLTEILNERGIKTHRQKVAQTTAKARKDNSSEKADAALQEEVARRQALAVFAAAPSKIGKAFLIYVLARMTESYEFEAWTELAAILGLPPIGLEDSYDDAQVRVKLEKLSEPDLNRAFTAILVMDARMSAHHDKTAKALMSTTKVDFKKVEATVRAEAKKKAEASPADKVKASIEKREVKAKANGKKK